MQKKAIPYVRRLTDKLEETPYTELENYEDNSEEHVNEKWLISYADLMTLLFGLFVMLYSIAMETQGRPDKVFSDILAGRNSLEELEKAIKEKELKLLDTKKEVANLNEQLNEKIKKLKSLDEENTKYKSLALQLQGELQQVQKQQGKQLPSGNEKKLIEETALLKTTIANNQKEIGGLKANIKSLLADLSGLNLKIDGFSREVEKLNNENLGLKADFKNNNFMIIVLNWTTPQHDIDLRVTDSFGRMYDYQNRAYKESSAKFIVDSRSGPGVEMWETPQIESGNYTVEFSFYNSYGNTEPAVMTGSIITKKGVFEIPETKLDFAKAKKKLFKIKSTDEGAITILPL